MKDAQLDHPQTDCAPDERPEPDYSNLPVVRQIERHAQITPNKVALSYGGQNLSYAAMISAAKQAAEGLKTIGVTPHSRVALLMNPCPELVCCLLGIHMLGATYVPIDPGFPTGRVEMILDDIEPTGVVSNASDLARLKANLSSKFSKALRSYETIREAGENKFHNFKAFPVTLEDESHIFFTSGTTGRPKGAISTHRNLWHGMSSSRSCFKLGSEQTILSVAGSSFSISTFELLSLLSCGGGTTIAKRDEILDIGKLFEIAKRVSVWHFVPTLLARLVEYAEQAPERITQLNQLETILTGGDNVPPDLLLKIRRLLPSVNLYVNYGASETNCMVTFWPVSDTQPEKTKIGSPQKNVRLKVLDKNRKPVVKGEVGELYVSSPGVISGYINRQELNSDKFFLFDGDRYFATGDMVRQDDDGLYEMLGREDFQIQLNGNRIELLEVESVVKKVPGIKDCVVAAKNTKDDVSTKTLVAYIVIDAQETPTVNEVRGILRRRLPNYMVPSLFLALDTIPTNHNGKVDRAGLPAPESCEILQSNKLAPIHGPTEQAISEIWRDLLNVDFIHANSDFFELGGDSISAVRAMTEISLKLGCHLTMPNVIENTTVRKLARLVADQRNKISSEKGDDIPPAGCLLLKPGCSELAPILLINGVVEYLDLAKELNTQRPVYAIYLPEEVDLIVNGAKSKAAVCTNSISSITDLYLSIISQLQPTGPYFLIGKSYGGIIAIEVARALESKGQKISLIGLLDTVVPDAFTAHKRLSFRISEHIRRTIKEGPGYLLSRLKQRASTEHLAIQTDTAPDNQSIELMDNIRVRHQVRKDAIFNTRLSPINRPLILIKAKDREYLYGERPSKDLGWSKYCDHLTVYEVPGDHHSILDANHVDEVARRLEIYT